MTHRLVVPVLVTALLLTAGSRIPDTAGPARGAGAEARDAKRAAPGATTVVRSAQRQGPRASTRQASDVGRLPVRIERHQPGAPVTLGVPFPKGVLASPDHVRVVRADGTPLATQVTEVTTWEPADPSIKWVWVFFFAEASPDYVLEFGPAVSRPMPAGRVQVVNNARDGGLAEVTTGPLRFTVRQGDGGFLSSAHLDLEGDGFDEEDLIATGPQAGRGAFADLLDEGGVDASRAVVTRTFIDRGSGPLHAILRIEGEYRYARDDNNAAPFVTRIHAYAGTPYVRVLHSWVYTGVPDRHRPQQGDYAHVATQNERIIQLDPTDEGWTQPEDQLQGLGLGLSLDLDPNRQVRTALRDGRWWSPGEARALAHGASNGRTGGDAGNPAGVISIFQTGPKPARMPPLPTSTPTERLAGFSAELRAGDEVVDRAERAAGWLDVFDGRRGVAIGVKHFLEEYPKAIAFDPATGSLDAFFWSPLAGPMSFARSSNTPASEGAIENWAQGLAKTSELLLYFHGADASTDEIARTMRLVQEPPVGHVDPAWYGRTQVFGDFASRSDRFPALQRALDYKFDWMLFNQRWEPWYGVFDHGDMMNTFTGDAWNTFGHGEPAQDYQWWLQFMRTGDPRVFDAALAFSRHLMDVDNTHWPVPTSYRGDSNYPLDYWSSLDDPPVGTFVGVGRRHAVQHWSHILSAHVWVPGWLAAYYLAGEQRGLDVATMTGDLYLRRPWGEHGLTGRRLYLSVWNLAEIWDATKDPRYKAELDDRVARMLRLQNGPDQYGALVMDRYGYTQIYASHGLERYLNATGDESVRRALVRHARAVRDNPPLNHWMESYLSSIHSLTLGYRFTGERSFLDELTRRLDVLKMDAIARPIDDSWTQAVLFEALEGASRLPLDPNRFRPPTGAGRAGAGRVAAASPGARAGGVASNAAAGGGRGGPFGEPRRANWAFGHGLRIYGWTTAFTVPYALAVLADVDRSATKETRR